jgi:hypothetical protein
MLSFAFTVSAMFAPVAPLPTLTIIPRFMPPPLRNWTGFGKR